MQSPDLHDWKVAKRAAFALAGAMGWTVLQLADGTKRVMAGGKPRDFPTWLALWSWLHQVRADQLGVKS